MSLLDNEWNTEILKKKIDQNISEVNYHRMLVLAVASGDIKFLTHEWNLTERYLNRSLSVKIVALVMIISSLIDNFQSFSEMIDFLFPLPDHLQNPDHLQKWSVFVTKSRSFTDKIWIDNDLWILLRYRTMYDIWNHHFLIKSHTVSRR